MENFEFTYKNSSAQTQNWYVGEGDYFSLTSGQSQSYQAQFSQGSTIAVTVSIGQNSTNTELTYGKSGWTMTDNPDFTLKQTSDTVSLSCSYDGTDSKKNPHKKHQHHFHAK